MMRGKLILVVVVFSLLWLGSAPGAAPQQQGGVASFRSGVDLVRVSAVVRDRKGRFISNLSARDFEILDMGEPQRITGFQHDLPAISVALLLDISGSMEARLDHAREAATQVLTGMDRGLDEAAVFTFDTRLQEVEPFTTGLQALPATLATVKPFGATSLHDAIARTAERLSNREGLRRAVIVFTDGQDNWSRLTPEEASAAASAIDVPVYIVGIVPDIDNPAADISAVSPDRSTLAGTLANLAMLTGGHAFIASTAVERGAAARQILDELRHQYLIAFQSSGKPGWHPLVVRTRDKDLTVRARSGYNAGQSRPVS